MFARSLRRLESHLSRVGALSAHAPNKALRAAVDANLREAARSCFQRVEASHAARAPKAMLGGIRHSSQFSLPVACKKTFTYPTGPVISLISHPDGQSVVSLSKDQSLIQNVYTSSKPIPLGVPGAEGLNIVAPISGRAPGSPPGLIAGGNSRGLLPVYYLDGGRWYTLLGHPNARVNAISGFPNDIFFVSGATDNTVLVWDPGKTDPTPTAKMIHGSSVTALTVFDRTSVASGAADGTIKIWLEQSINQWNLSPFPPLRHQQAVVALGQLNDQGTQLVVSSSKDATIKAWNPRVKDSLRYAVTTPSPVTAMTVFQNNVVATGHSTGDILFWDLPHQTLLYALPKEHTNAVSGLTVLADGSLCSGSADRKIKWWI